MDVLTFLMSEAPCHQIDTISNASKNNSVLCNLTDSFDFLSTFKEKLSSAFANKSLYVAPTTTEEEHE